LCVCYLLNFDSPNYFLVTSASNFVLSRTTEVKQVLIFYCSLHCQALFLGPCFCGICTEHIFSGSQGCYYFQTVYNRTFLRSRLQIQSGMGIATGNIINFLNPATCGEAINLFLLPEIGETGVTPFLSLIKQNLYVISW